MGKVKDSSPEVCAQVEILKQEGYPQRQIAERLGRSQSCVCRMLQRRVLTGSCSRKRGSGRPRCTTSRTDNLIKRCVNSNPFATASGVREELMQLPVVPSIRTIRRRLHEKYGLVCRKAAKKPLLSKKNLRDRIRFCRLHKHWTVEQWKSVLFSDESTFHQFTSINRKVWRPPGERYNRRFTVPVVKRPPTTMVWGAISAVGTGPLWFMPPNTTINRHVYVGILQEHLPVCMPAMGCTVFQQDGAPCHTARSVKQWLCVNNIPLLEHWPGNSPDLNIIENCWDVMKRKVAQHRPKSAADLREKLQLVWSTEITAQYCAQLAASMPRRIAAVLKNKGYSSKY
jgi:transposase